MAWNRNELIITRRKGSKVQGREGRHGICAHLRGRQAERKIVCSEGWGGGFQRRTKKGLRGKRTQRGK